MGEGRGSGNQRCSFAPSFETLFFPFFFVVIKASKDAESAKGGSHQPVMTLKRVKSSSFEGTEWIPEFYDPSLQVSKEKKKGKQNGGKERKGKERKETVI